jgi:hypothetical protein
VFSDPGAGWALAFAIIGFGALALEQVRQSLQSGLALGASDRAERAEDSANFWAIVGLYGIVGALFAAVGLWLVARLIARGTAMTWWTPVSVAWAAAILVAHQSVWNPDNSRRPPLERAVTIFFAVSQGLILLGMVAFAGLAIAFMNSPKSPTPTQQLVVKVEDHGIWYVTPKAARLSHASKFLLLFIILPGVAAGISNGWVQRRTRRIRPKEGQ